MYTRWVRSHLTPTQYTPKFNLSLHNTTAAVSIQRSPIVVDAGMIIKALYAMVNNMRPHEERLESEAESANIFFE